MNFLKNSQTNWKYIFIVVIIVVILVTIISGGILWFSARQEVSIEFPEIKKPEKIIEEETTNWKTYKNEGLGIEFQYPKEWISITFDSQVDNEVYILESSNETVEKVFYFKPQNMIAFILYGEDYSSICPFWDEFFLVPPHSAILKVLYPDKEIKTIYTTKRPIRQWCFDAEFMGNVSLSPNGEYIGFVFHGYEWSNSILKNLNTGEDIHGASFYNPYKDVFWSSSSKTLAIISPPCEMEPCTTQEGIFVSDYGEPGKLNKILPLTFLDSVDDLYFVNDDKLFFSLTKGVLGKTLKYLTKYEYDIKTKILKKIEEKQL